MKSKSLLFRVALTGFLLVTYNASAQTQQSESYDQTDGVRGQVVLDRYFQPMPDITRFERFCVVTEADSVVACTQAMPETDYTAFQRRRSLERIDALESIAAGVDPEEPLTPWQKFCLVNSTAECYASCEAGTVEAGC